MSTTKLRRMLKLETNRILLLCHYWQETLETNGDVPEDITGRIRAHIGLSNLLVNDKFQQFVRLLDTHESGTPDCGRKMTLADLEGFWDLVYIQIDDTIKKFEVLQVLKENNWEEVVKQNVCHSPIKKRSPLVSIANGTPKNSPKTDHGRDARRRLSEAKSRVQQLRNINTAPASTNSHSSTYSVAIQENIPVEELQPNTAL